MKKPIVFYDITLKVLRQYDKDLSIQNLSKTASMLDDLGVDYLEVGRQDFLGEAEPKYHALIRQFNSSRARPTFLGRIQTDCPHAIHHHETSGILAARSKTITISASSLCFHSSGIADPSYSNILLSVESAIKHLKRQDHEVVFNADHYFDGYKRNPIHALRLVQTAVGAGADWVVFCDTNGGSLPRDVYDTINKSMIYLIRNPKPHDSTPCGIHAYNDCGLALANSIAAVQAGVGLVVGSINGIGERCGVTDLVQVIATLQLKMNYKVVQASNLLSLTGISRFVNELTSLPDNELRPFVGRNAFAHANEIQMYAAMKHPEEYEHVDPGLVGNRRRCYTPR